MISVCYIVGAIITFIITSGILSILMEKEFRKLENDDIFMCGIGAIIPALIWPIMPGIILAGCILYFGAKYSSILVRKLLNKVKV